MLCLASGVDYDESIRPSDELQPISDAASEVVIKASKSPEWIWSLLKNYHVDNETDKRFSLVLDPAHTDQQPEILFLDLRLFSGKNIGEEVAFFEKLIYLARNFEDNKNLPWPGFSKDEIDLVEEWLTCDNKKREDDIYITALTFLPRIISLTDFSLPIMLFSSTGRRDIAEKLKPYGNIITVFDKPKFTVDMPVNIAEQTSRKFREGIEQALQLLVARNKCKTVINRSAISQPSPHLFFHNKGIHVELFIDETIDPLGTYLGGCFAVFSGSDNETAKRKADSFDDDLVRNNVRYFYSLGVGAATASVIKNKKEDASPELRSTLSCSASSPDYLGFVRLFHNNAPALNPFDLLNPASADNVYRFALMGLVELFLYETLPALLGNMTSEATVSIFVDGRIKECPNGATGANEVIQAKYCLGLGTLRLGRATFIYSIARDSIYPIVLDIISFRNKTRRHIERLVGVEMPYKSDERVPKRVAKYFVCRNCHDIHSIDTRNDIEIDFHVSNIAVVENTNQKGFAFIAPHDPSYTQLFVPAKEYSNFNSAQKGDFVLYDSIELSSSPGKYPTAKRVRKLTDSEITYRMRNPLNIECSCANKDISPDYRALHYIADEILNHVPEIHGGIGYGESVKLVPGGFDDILDDDLKSVILASRYLDNDDIISSLVEVSIANTHPIVSQYKARQYLFGRISTELANLEGKEFVEVARRLREQ